jgi:hypothetical protein
MSVCHSNFNSQWRSQLYFVGHIGWLEYLSWILVFLLAAWIASAPGIPSFQTLAEAIQASHVYESGVLWVDRDRQLRGP